MLSYNKFVTEKCWDGYKQVGMKKKNGKDVPNCVPESKELDELTTTQLIKKFAADTIFKKKYMAGVSKVKEIMEAAVDLDIPLIVEASIGSNWNEAH